MFGLSLRCARQVAAAVKQFHTSPIVRIDPSKVEEVRIPVPWGHIAGKWWGSKNEQPILAIHGWLDNAGSWDPLASVLPDDYALLAIDIPGNGFSSHFQPFQNYYFIDTVPLVNTIKKYYNFDKLHLLGHSGGSATCLLFSAIYPDDVISYFGIDYLLYAYGDEKKRADNLGKLIDKKIALALRNEKGEKSYTKEEVITSWVQATKGSLTPESVEILMKRGVRELPDGKVVFTRDQRLKAPDLFSFNPHQVYKFAENVKCDVCLVKGAKSKLFDQGVKYTPEILDIIKKNAKSFELHTVDGHHHLHMDMPNDISKLYIEFRKKIVQN